MSISAQDMIDLIDAGLTPDQMKAVLKIVSRQDDAENERLRAQRERKQRNRSRDGHGTVTGQERDGHGDDEAKKEIPPTPPKEKNIYITPETANAVSAPKRSRRKPETPLPMEFPTAEQITDAETRASAAGVDIKIKFQAERFRNHAETTDRRCRDWPAAWRNWVSTAIERAGGRPAGEPPPLLADRSDLIRAYRHSGTWPSEWGKKPTPEELAA